MNNLNYFTIFGVIFCLYIANMQSQREVRQAEGEYLALLAKADRVDMNYASWAIYYSQYSKNKISPFVKTLTNYKGD